MDKNRHENLEIIVQLEGRTIFQAGWQNINVSTSKEDIALAYTLINKYREYLNGFLDGIKHPINISKE